MGLGCERGEHGVARAAGVAFRPEFTWFQIRVPLAYAKSERGAIAVTHRFLKERPRTPREPDDDGNSRNTGGAPKPACGSPGALTTFVPNLVGLSGLLPGGQLEINAVHRPTAKRDDQPCRCRSWLPWRDSPRRRSPTCSQGCRQRSVAEMSDKIACKCGSPTFY